MNEAPEYRKGQLIIYNENIDGKIKFKYGFIDRKATDDSYYIRLIKGTNIFKTSRPIKVSYKDLSLPGDYVF